MKKIFLLFSFLLISPALNAQVKNLNDDSKIETLFGSDEYHSGAYGCPEIKFTRFIGTNAIAVGGRGGWIINHTFSIGGAGYGLVTSPEVESYQLDSITTEPYYLRTGWGGLFLQYTNSSNSVVHFTVNSLIGAGGVSCTPKLTKTDNYYHNNNNVVEYPASAYFIFEPGLGVEFYILKFFRIEIGGSYRMTMGVDMESHVRNSDLSGPSANLAFKFGNF